MVNVKSASDTLYDEVTKHSVDLMRVEEGARKKVVRLLKQLEKELVTSINEIDPDSPLQTTYRVQRQKKLLAQVKESVRSTYKSAKVVITDELTDLAETEGGFTQSAINKAVHADIATVGVTRQFAVSVATQSLVQGTVMSDWMERLSDRTQARVSDEIRKGMLAGETNYDIIKRIRGKPIGGGKYAGGVMDISTREATTLVRTAVQTVANNARYEMLQNNSDIISGYQALVTLDTRTSTICKARSGMQWDLKGKPIPNTGTKGDFPGPPPWHYQCRSTLVPIIKGWNDVGTKTKGKLGSNKATQSSMDGKVPQTMNYEDWLKKQPKEVQVEALGPSKYKLWKEGKIKSFRDLTDQSGRPLTVAELKTRGAGGIQRSQGSSSRPKKNILREDTLADRKYSKFGNELDVMDFEETDEYRKSISGLTEKEKAAVYRYSESGFDYSYSYVNYYNRTGTLPPNHALDDMKAAVQNIDSAVSKVTLPKDTLLYRATNLQEYGIHKKDLTEGLVLKDKSVSSTSLLRSVADTYKSRDGVILEIKNAKELPALPMLSSDLAAITESEVLLPRNTRLKILKVITGEGNPVRVVALRLP